MSMTEVPARDEAMAVAPWGVQLEGGPWFGPFPDLEAARAFSERYYPGQNVEIRRLTPPSMVPSPHEVRPLRKRRQ